MSAFQQIRERIWRGLFGAGFNYLAAILAPLILVPIFIGTWGVEGYGLWVTAQALASFVSFACAGFILASSPEISIAYAKNNKIEINTILSTTFLTVLPLGGASSVLASILVFWNTDYSNLKTFHYLFVPLSLCAVVSLMPTLLLKTLSSCGRYGESDFMSAILKIVEVVLVISFLLFVNATPISTAYILVAINIASAVIGFIYLKFHLPWIYLKFAFFDRNLLRRLARPILSTSAYTIGYSQLLIQGPRLLVGYAFGMADVAVFNIINIIARLIKIPVEIGVTVFRAEISFAHGARQFENIKDLFMVASQVAMIITFMGVLFVLISGNYLISILSKKEMTMDLMLFSILVMSIIFECISFPSLTYLIAINKLFRPAVALITSLVLGCLACLACLRVAGPYGVAVAIAGSTFVFGATSVTMTLQAIGLAPGEYLTGIGKISVKAIALELRRGLSILGIGRTAK
jgi:O-antigen/teichoic acid export membrane protein